MMGKYRFWNEKTKEMIYNLSFKTDKGDEIKVCSYPNCISMQYMLLKDKYCIDIYEGDVVYYENNMENGVGVVEFDIFMSPRVRWITQNTPKPSAYSHISVLGCCHEVEVIGNIYENSNLLEV